MKFLFGLALVGGTKEVIDSFYRVERSSGHFDEDGEPVAHRAVPKTGELEGAKFASAKRFRRYESGFGVDIFGKIEFVAVDVADIAYEIHGIEVRGLRHYVLVFVDRRVDLG